MYLTLSLSSTICELTSFERFEQSINLLVIAIEAKIDILLYAMRHDARTLILLIHAICGALHVYCERLYVCALCSARLRSDSHTI